MSLNRTEYKYLITLDNRDQFESDLDDRLIVDSLASADGCYPIVTQYYETPTRECYWEKQRSLASRRKIRVRIYGTEGGKIPPTGFIEIKHKHFGFGAKRRLFLPVEQAIAFANGEHDVLRKIKRDWSRSQRMIIAEIYDLLERRHFEPAIQLRYDRKALMTPDGQLRITFDTELKCRSKLLELRPDDQRFEDYIIPAHQSILEVKSIGPVPFWFREYAGNTGLMRRSFSKFCTAMEVIDPVLRKQISGSSAA
ncbi:polyphosphate polymerase domain-containing protein [Akkermansiaceae bacterium]|nr:polyphosphate polymerase domain-containing protein [Akkermansiaceae bacterium]MDA7933244.1 polyphosphate polymerase domain-containing protein [bacterium]MDB0055669.1 polyphosphate polymerase domain-containing protein [Akkermansiaceae bacterium]MDB4142409.1 polyphosphate polymerase domain-containing protein [Akkermansiaceae bacterium]MDB4272850.1 polyphosphate polymerase domain-containing protein [Akkermansiaceae bacterium]